MATTACSSPCYRLQYLVSHLDTVLWLSGNESWHCLARREARESLSVWGAGKNNKRGDSLGDLHVRSTIIFPSSNNTHHLLFYYSLFFF